MTTTLTLIIALLIMLLGLFGSILPLIPGPPIVWLGALFYGWSTDFQTIGWGTLLLLGVIGVAAATSDIWMGALGNRSSGESLLTTVLSLIGGIIGLFLFALPGMLIGSIIGVLLPNWRRWREQGYIFNVSWRVVKSWVVGTLVQTGLSLAMIAIFVLRLVSA